MPPALTDRARGSTLLYGRVSDDRPDNLAVDRQLQDCWQLVNARAWEVDAQADVYRDDGFSASRRAKKKRPRFEAMLERIAGGGVARVVVWNVDRLYRDPRDLLRLTDLSERGVEVVTVTGGDLDLNTDDGRMRSGIMSFVAQREADATSTRVRRQKQQRREAGLPHGSPRPFGWSDGLTPDPVEAVALRDAMEAVTRGASCRDLAETWNTHGLARPRGRSPWVGGDVRRVLESPRHVGRVVHRGQIVVDTDGNEVQAAWPPIVSRELWDACRAVLSSRSTGVGLPRRRQVLTGLLICGDCGAKMTRSNSGRRTIWRCGVGTGGCGKVSIGAASLEALIAESLFAYVDGPELQAALARRNDGRMRQIRAELIDLDAQRRALLDAFSSGGNAKVLRQASDALDVQQRRLELELGQANPLEQYQGDGVLRERWPLLTRDEKHAAIEAGLGTITVMPAAARGCRFDATRVRFNSR
jgi:site-specific DNA recombinase